MKDEIVIVIKSQPIGWYIMREIWIKEKECTSIYKESSGEVHYILMNSTPFPSVILKDQQVLKDWELIALYPLLALFSSVFYTCLSLKQNKKTVTA